MKSVKKNKSIKIDQNEFGIFSLIKEGLLGTCTHLMDEKEVKEIVKTGKFKGESFPYPLSFTPKNEDTLHNIKSGTQIDLILKEEIVGHIEFKTKFKNNKNFSDIFSPNTCSLEDMGATYISGEIEIYHSPIQEIKANFQEVKNNLNAQKITAIVSSFDPLHRAHERMFRWTIDKADLVVLFLIESYENNGLDFTLKETYLRNFIQNYLPPDRIFIFPLKDINIFHAHLNPGLESIIAKSLGCTKLVVMQNHTGLGMFYDHNQPKTILDDFSKDYGIEVIVLPEFVFCDQCRMIVSTRSCPHGSHHHLHYNSQSLKDLLRAGIIPPAIFMRKEVSSIILASLFPNRLKNMQKMYNELFSTNGILEYKNDEEFYQKLLEIHQMSYMV
ncbi:sulfate adenylyltransferase [Campylobacter hepaticus]|uniref:Sulfate adenylyltransferase n=1 Tax=Campylobacter hepaticus TaxID=1813019 RepID=A0A424Z1N9_9BACT|nr:sulfate adenylyltransferase [Campylobacter hepaticus]AXP09334.1 sulfate adenylyltransferase [Campylobacter hepaticus]MCZ0772922.1 sulfate adenylyltransferase [Campylobacter hepaticus]MCZ0774391.1 sulfate adenylyltransferase [Campylobacter hepaticus]MCZ0775643.1 sulfate adenylyltransferase [Campylobacter hepaticus]MDX2323572.1 sulfate adenylyltransferase [Campylobacter hepaticus]